MSQEYQPITQKYLLPMTSYLVELGRIGGQWAVRIFRGPTEIGTTRLTTDLNHNEIFNAIQNCVSMPMFSPERMFGSIGRMVQEARINTTSPSEPTESGTEP
ncbi:MAG: hypothetical protein ACXACF_06780 [Candidatus Hermodarchaeia archaeon]|jgi:hypothetical protein